MIIGTSSSRSLTYARCLAAQGYDLILIAPQRTRLQAAASRITDSSGASVEVLSGDLRLTEDLHRIVQTLAFDASITLLVNHSASGKPCLYEAAKRLGTALASGFQARRVGAMVEVTGKADCPLDDAVWTLALVQLGKEGHSVH